MGYRGKLAEGERARALRLSGMTVPDIAASLGVSRSSVSLWVRDLGVEIRRRRLVGVRPNRLRDERLAEIEEMDRLGVARLGVLDRQAFLAAGAALYAGEGAKRDGTVAFANSDPGLIAMFCAWFRSFFEIDERRLRCSLYLHEGLDVDAALAFWSEVTNIPAHQFRKPYRAVPKAGIRHNKHEHGCVTVVYASSRTHRALMGVVRALVSSTAYSGVAQSAERLTVNQNVASSSLAPGAPYSRTWARSSVVRAGDS
jgi:transcriptional regulator with XRE-family HTH domain